MWTGRWVELRVAPDDPGRAEAEQFAEEQKQRWEAAQALVAKAGLSALEGEFMRELAQLRVDRQAKGLDFAHASAELLGLTARASWQSDYPQRWPVLIALRLEFGKLCVEAGKPELFASVYADSVLVPGTLFVSPYELIPASAKLLDGDDVALGAPSLVRLRTSVHAFIEPRAEAASAPSQGIEEAVREALLDNDANIIRELGVRAVPVLEQVVRDKPEELPSQGSSDPLVLLLDLREQRGAQLILDLLDGGAGFLFKKRVIRAMVEAQVLSDQGTWSFVTDADSSSRGSLQPPTLVESIWLEVIARLVADPEVGRDSIWLAQTVASYDALDMRLQQALIKLLDSADPDAPPAVMAALKECQGRQSVVPVLEHAVGHRDAAVRAAAAGLLVLYPRSAALRARSSDPSPQVRVAVARSLIGSVGRPSYRESDRQVFWREDKDRAVAHVVDERDASGLAQLLQDEDAQVRELAMQALFEHPDLTIPAEILLSLVHDSSAQVRSWLAQWPPKRPADPKLLEALAHDTDPTVLKELDARLEKLATTRPDGTDARDNRGALTPDVEVMWQAAYAPALIARLTNTSSPYLNLRTPLLIVGHDPETAATLLRAVQEKGSQAAQQALLREMANSKDNGFPFAWEKVGLDLSAAWARTAWSLPMREGSPKKALLTLYDEALPQPRSALRVLLVDEKQPADLRLFSAAQTAFWAGEAWRKALLDAIAAAGKENNVDATVRRVDLMLSISKNITPIDERIALLAQLVRLPDPPDWAFSYAMDTMRNWSVPKDLAVEIVERASKEDSEVWSGLSWFALKSCGFSAQEPHTELIQRVLANRKTLRNGIAAIGQTHLDEHLPFLENAILGQLTGAAPEDANWDRSIRGEAARALASYLSDPAAEILLKGLGATTDEEVRKACFDALDTIRRYQDEKERWTQRKSSKQAQDAAIAELALLLIDRDANVRAQAARSLGALGAVELLPKLVNMLKDPAPEVRGAAQAAIDVLTAQKPAESKND